MNAKFLTKSYAKILAMFFIIFFFFIHLNAQEFELKDKNTSIVFSHQDLNIWYDKNFKSLSALANTNQELSTMIFAQDLIKIAAKELMQNSSPASFDVFVEETKALIDYIYFLHSKDKNFLSTLQKIYKNSSLKSQKEVLKEVRLYQASINATKGIWHNQTSLKQRANKSYLMFKILSTTDLKSINNTNFLRSFLFTKAPNKNHLKALFFLFLQNYQNDIFCTKFVLFDNLVLSQKEELFLLIKSQNHSLNERQINSYIKNMSVTSSNNRCCFYSFGEKQSQKCQLFSPPNYQTSIENILEKQKQALIQTIFTQTKPCLSINSKTGELYRHKNADSFCSFLHEMFLQGFLNPDEN